MIAPLPPNSRSVAKNWGPTSSVCKKTPIHCCWIASLVQPVQPCFEKMWVKLDQNHFLQVWGWKSNNKNLKPVPNPTTASEGTSIPRYLISCEKGIKTATSDAIPRFTSTYRNLEAQSFMRQPGSCFVVGSFGIGLLLRSSLNQW